VALALASRPVCLYVGSRPFVAVWLFTATYAGLITAARVTSVISLGPRLLFPVFPLALAMLAALASEAWRAFASAPRRRLALAGATALFVLSYVGTNSWATYAQPPLTDPHALARRFDLADGTGTPLRDWVATNIGQGETLLATDGQATAFHLQRPAVSLVERYFSDSEWTEESVRQVLRQYAAEYVVVYPGALYEEIPAQYDFPFLADLANRSPPEWLAIAAENEAVIIYRLAAP
jgi:hypothetical protein